jgi:hypothetical protein
MSARRDDVIIGASPRAHLLPPELAIAARARVIHRLLLLMVVAVLIVTGAGVVEAYRVAGVAKAALDDERAVTTSLLGQQTKYTSATDLDALVTAVTAATDYGVSTAVDWNAFIDELEDALPKGVNLDSVAPMANAPWEAPLGVTGPLRVDRVATLQLQVSSSKMLPITEWVRAVDTLPGFADSSIDGWRLEQEKYITTITLNLGAGALAHPVDASAGASATAPATTAPSSTEPSTTETGE